MAPLCLQSCKIDRGDPEVSSPIAEKRRGRPARLSVLSAIFSVALSCAPGAIGAANRTSNPEAELSPRCSVIQQGVSNPDDMRNGTFIKPDHWRFAFQIDCDLPFHYDLEAQNGALEMEGNERNFPAPPGFTTSAPYNVILYMQSGSVALYSRCPGLLLLARLPPCSGAFRQGSEKHGSNPSRSPADRRGAVGGSIFGENKNVSSASHLKR
jgi:hypothetical protein